MAPLISFVLPLYNVAATLDEALASIASQTHEDWEAVCVDDGSTDETASRLEAWRRRNRRIRGIRFPENRGIVPALNAGLAAARGEYVARMDGDDIAHPRRLERQLDHLRSLEPRRVAVVGCRVRFFPEEAVAAGARKYAAWLNSLLTPEEHARDLYVECTLAHPSMLFRTEVVRGLGGYESRGWPEDYDLLLRLHAAGFGAAKVEEELLLWREHPGRTSRTHPDYRLATFFRCKAHYLRRGPLSRGQSCLVFGAGPTGKALGRALLDQGAAMRGYVDLDPRKIGQVVHGRPVLSLGEALDRRGSALGLVALGKPEARAAARAELRDAGWEEGADFLCAA